MRRKESERVRFELDDDADEERNPGEGFDTFNPSFVDLRVDGDDHRRGKPVSDAAQPPKPVTSVRDRLVMEINFKDLSSSFRDLRKKVLLNVLDRVNHFKLSGTSRVRTSEYMRRRNREDPLIYQFGIEKDPLLLQVLCQVLYDELENSLKNLSNIEKTYELEQKRKQGKEDSMQLKTVIELVEKVRREESDRFEKDIYNLNLQQKALRRATEAKDKLISRLKEDKSMYRKYMSSLSSLLVSLSPHCPPKLHETLSRSHAYTRWLVDYEETDDRTYNTNADWIDRKEREKADWINLLDMNMLGKLDIKDRESHLPQRERSDSLEETKPQIISPKKARDHDAENKENVSKGNHSFNKPPSKYRSNSSNQYSSNFAGLNINSFEEFKEKFESMNRQELLQLFYEMSDKLSSLKKELRSLKTNQQLEQISNLLERTENRGSEPRKTLKRLTQQEIIDHIKEKIEDLTDSNSSLLQQMTLLKDQVKLQEEESIKLAAAIEQCVDIMKDHSDIRQFIEGVKEKIGKENLWDDWQRYKQELSTARQLELMQQRQPTPQKRNLSRTSPSASKSRGRTEGRSDHTSDKKPRVSSFDSRHADTRHKQISPSTDRADTPKQEAIQRELNEIRIMRLQVESLILENDRLKHQMKSNSGTLFIDKKKKASDSEYMNLLAMQAKLIEQLVDGIEN